MEYKEKLEALRSWLGESRRMVFFGGAGVSTESGIPDFRSVDGLYSQQWDEPPEVILSHDYFLRHTEKFYRFYRQKMLFPDAKPNAAHRALAALEAAGRLAAVVTQNIDGLHQAAGSRNVLELHGSVLRNRCMDCGASHDGLALIMNAEGAPRCPRCGGLVKPDVVLYGEALDDSVVERAVDAISRADLLLVCGTSLSVYPAAGLLRYYTGNRLALVNRDPTPADGSADLVIHGKIGEVLARTAQ